jgi:hypothetical protein
MIQDTSKHAIIPMEEYLELKKCFDDTNKYISEEVSIGSYEAYRLELGLERERYSELENKNRNLKFEVSELLDKIAWKDEIIDRDSKTLEKLRNNLLFLILFGRY